MGADARGPDRAEALRGRVWVHSTRVLCDGRVGPGDHVVLLWGSEGGVTTSLGVVRGVRGMAGHRSGTDRDAAVLVGVHREPQPNVLERWKLGPGG